MKTTHLLNRTVNSEKKKEIVPKVVSTNSRTLWIYLKLIVSLPICEREKDRSKTIFAHIKLVWKKK